MFGVLVRIQTAFIGYFLFGVETHNVCMVKSNSKEPATVYQIYRHPKEFFDVTKMFETILRICFLASLVASFVYFVKIYKVLKWHKSDKETYLREAKPYVT